MVVARKGHIRSKKIKGHKQNIQNRVRLSIPSERSLDLVIMILFRNCKFQ
jgi:hypothetical protein